MVRQDGVLVVNYSLTIDENGRAYYVEIFYMTLKSASSVIVCIAFLFLDVSALWNQWVIRRTSKTQNVNDPSEPENGDFFAKKVMELSGNLTFHTSVICRDSRLTQQ